VALTTCQDYKRLLDGDRGPNTGGMGGYSPSVLIGTEAPIMEAVVAPTVRGLLAEGRAYRGVLYVGLMLTASGPRVLEYNARFGDPEAELIAVRMESDLVSAMQATLAGRLEDARLTWHEGASVCAVLAASGYPGTPRTGDPISGCDQASGMPGTQVFHAATREDGGVLRTAGGRVLTVTARGASFSEAARRCYDAVGVIRFSGRQVRTDIARVAIESETRGTGPS